MAIAVFGVVMLAGFNSSFEGWLTQSDAPAEVKAQLNEQKQKFTEIDVSAIADPRINAEASHAVKRSFLTGFRLVSYLAAALAFLSAICSWIFIEGKLKGKEQAVP